MFKYTFEGKVKIHDIKPHACMYAYLGTEDEGPMSWSDIGTGAKLGDTRAERKSARIARFGENCNQTTLGHARQSPEWAESVREFAEKEGHNVDTLLAKMCRGPRVSRSSAPSENGAPTAVVNEPTPTPTPTPTFGVSASVTILRSEQRIAMSDLTAAHKTAMVELEAAHVRAVEELRIAQVSAEQALLTEHAGALEALKAEEAAAAEAESESAEAGADNEGGDEPPSPPPAPSEPSEPADVVDAEHRHQEDDDVDADVEAYSHDTDGEPSEEADVSAEVEEARVEELRKRKEHLENVHAELRSQFEEATTESTQSALHGLMQKKRGEILEVSRELGEPSDTDKLAA